jgi:type IV pilus assembly protein PilC
MEFRCRLASSSGEITEGIYVADSESRLRREFDEKGLFVLSVRRRGGWLALRAGTRGEGAGRISHREFLVFNQELATLLKAGMPLVQSLDILRARVANPTFKAALDSIHDKVKAGAALSDAVTSHGALFPPVYAASLVAGERSGDLEGVLRRYVAYDKVLSSVRRKTLSALIYPAILVTMMVVLVAIIVLKVVPAFSDFYANFGRELPLSTRIIVGLSNVLLDNIWLILAAVVGIGVGLMAWLRRPGQRLRFDRLLLRVPWAGGAAKKFATSQAARTMATLLGGGIPLVQALEISARAMSNRFLAGEVEYVREKVQEGHGFAAALSARGVFPDVAVKMVEVGESTGALQEMLNSLAEFYDEEIDTEVGRFITIIEPLLLIIMGIIIAGVVLALYMPLFELSSVGGGI